VELIFLCLEPLEKSFDPAPAVIAVDDRVLLVILQIGKRGVYADLCRRGVLKQLFLGPCVLRSRKGLDRTVLQREQRIRDHKIVVDADRISETLTYRARTERGIKAEEMRLGLFVRRAVVFTDIFVGKL
jgi:hypothetical protein